MDSTAFRKGYRHLTESVSVVRFGRVVGVYIPVPGAATDEAPSYEADTGLRIRTPMVGSAGWTRLAWLIAELDGLDVWLRIGERAARRYRRLTRFRDRTDWGDRSNRNWGGDLHLDLGRLFGRGPLRIRRVRIRPPCATTVCDHSGRTSSLGRRLGADSCVESVVGRRGIGPLQSLTADLQSRPDRPAASGSVRVSCLEWPLGARREGSGIRPGPGRMLPPCATRTRAAGRASAG
jgi:hypothetical protein